MADTTLKPQPLERSEGKHDQPQDPQKVHTLHPKLHLLATQDTTNVSLRKLKKICLIRRIGKNIVKRITQFMTVLQLNNF